MAQQVTRPAARLTVLSGPSGVGRRRVAELARARSPARWRPVPVTTRQPGPGERDGADYRFVDDAVFARLVASEGLLEWAVLGAYRYGTEREPIETRLRGGEPVLLSLDLPGARQVRRAMPSAQLVLLVPAGTRDTPGLPDLPEGDLPEAGVGADATVTADTVARAADELVRLLGSPALL